MRWIILLLAVTACKTEDVTVTEAGIITETSHTAAWTSVYTYDCGSDRSPMLCLGTTYHPEEWDTYTLTTTGLRFDSGRSYDFEQYRRGDSVNVTHTDTYWIRENKPRKLISRRLVMYRPRKPNDPREGQ